MTLEQAILDKVKALPPEKQQEILDFAEFLMQRFQSSLSLQDNIPSVDEKVAKPPLGQRLRAIRAKIVESGEPLLTIAEIEQEMAEQRNRLGFGDE